MPDFTISLTERQAIALTELTNEYNKRMNTTLTDVQFLDRMATAVIKRRIKDQRDAELEVLKQAYESATNSVQDQVDTLLGITI